MFKKILVPIDFSECSVNALKYAIQLAEKFQAFELILLHAYTVRVAYGEMAFATMDQADEIVEEFNELEKQVKALKQIRYKTLTINGELITAIKQTRQEENIELIVMGTQGANTLDREILGTNAYNVVSEAGIPTLIIPQNATFHQIKNIALGSDYKSINRETLEPLKQLNNLFGSKIHIIHISDKEQLEISEAEQAKKFEQYLKNTQHSYHFMINDDVEAGITTYINTHNIDMLALIPRKHNFFQLLYGSSESKKMIFHTKIPLLAI